MSASRFVPATLCCLAVFCGCGPAGWGLRDEPAPGAEVETEIQRSDRQARESRTLSSLAAIERSLNDYIRAEGRIPPKLDLLVPKYAAEIPAADAAAGRHAASAKVAYYPSDVIRDGVIDGTRLKDTGGWGYAYNDRRVIVFVDCTHQNSRDRPWYQERGVF